MDIPDPDPTKNIPTTITSSQGIQTAKRSLEVSEEVRKRIVGIIFYYPYLCKETIPTAETNSLVGDEKTFSIFWQDRLVPESNVAKLQFFPGKTACPNFDKLKKRIKV